MTSQPNLEEIKTLVEKLPIQEQIALLEDMEDKLETLNLMKLAETGFAEWDDPQEDIYPDNFCNRCSQPEKIP